MMERDPGPGRRTAVGEAVTDVLVTGSAGGIGDATVRAFLGRGDRVVGVDRARSVVSHGSYRAFSCDVRDPVALEAALDEAAAAGFRIAHVVAIAGGALVEEKMATDVAEVSLETFRASVEQNLTSAFVTLQAALPHLRATGGDRSVAFTSSTDALLSYGMAGYSAAKAGLLGLVHALAEPLGREGIRINAVAPGDVPTERNVREWAHIPDWYDRLRDATALGRLATPDDIAAAFVALVSLGHVTGQTLVVDGGLMVTRR